MGLLARCLAARTSTLIADVVEGNEYLIRVGGWAGSGDEGPGSLSIFCAPCGDGICDPDGGWDWWSGPEG